MRNELSGLIDQVIVVDTCSNWIYIGTLDHVDKAGLVLRQADAHDITDTKVSKEFYIFNSKATGIKVNRRRVYVNLAYVVGFSRFDEIQEF